MPKKKLTKKQVMLKMRNVRTALYDLFLDKFAYGSESRIPISADKLKDMYNIVIRAVTKIK
jgi:hypothetical protein